MHPADYSVVGLQVRILFRDLYYTGRVKREAGPFADPLYLVDLDDPVPFDGYADNVGADGEARKGLRRQLTADGCLSAGGEVTCVWIRWRDLELLISDGSLTEYMEPDCRTVDTCKGPVVPLRTWPGALGSVDPGIAVLELFDPVGPDQKPSRTAEDVPLGGFMEEGRLLAVPIDLNRLGLDHGFRIMRTKTAKYYEDLLGEPGA